MGLPSNPFSPSHWTPETIPYVFSDPGTGEPAAPDESAVCKLRAGGWNGILLGPHGAGKSTMLAQLARHIEFAGLSARRLRFTYSRMTHLPALMEALRAKPSQVLLFDSAECLPPWLLSIVVRIVRLRRAGLILTAHDIPRFGTFSHLSIIPVVPDARLLTRVICRETRGMLPPGWPSQDLVQALLKQHNGNAREVLADLYRRVESPDFPAGKS